MVKGWLGERAMRAGARACAQMERPPEEGTMAEPDGGSMDVLAEMIAAAHPIGEAVGTPKLRKPAAKAAPTSRFGGLSKAQVRRAVRTGDRVYENLDTGQIQPLMVGYDRLSRVARQREAERRRENTSEVRVLRLHTIPEMEYAAPVEFAPLDPRSPKRPLAVRRCDACETREVLRDTGLCNRCGDAMMFGILREGILTRAQMQAGADVLGLRARGFAAASRELLDKLSANRAAVDPKINAEFVAYKDIPSQLTPENRELLLERAVYERAYRAEFRRQLPVVEE